MSKNQRNLFREYHDTEKKKREKDTQVEWEMFLT